jgi:hypothetical protein
LVDPDGTTTAVEAGYASLSRRWQQGDRVVLELAMPVRLTAAHPRVDAVRGCRAIERGPLVYAVEQTDLPDTVAADDLCLLDGTADRLRAEYRADLLGGCVVVTGPAVATDGTQLELVAVPYCLWANRDVGPMRVWLPLASTAAAEQ